MAKANESKSARQSIDVPSGRASPALASDTARTSIDSKVSEAAPETTKSVKEDTNAVDNVSVPADGPAKLVEDATPGAAVTEPDLEIPVPRISLESTHSQATGALSLDVSRAASPLPELASTNDDPTSDPVPSSPTALKAELISLRETHKQSAADHKEDINSHLERIDALQSKLNYLAKQLAETAKANADSAPAGSLEKKVAEQDVQIAALLEEGQNLSKTELKHMGAIKKLRAKLGDSEKETADLKRKLAKAEQATNEQKERAARAEATEKSAQEKLKIIARIERDVEILQAEKEAAGVMIADLRRQLSESMTRAEEAEQRAQTDALEAERRTVAELRDEIADLKLEKKLAEDRAKAEVKEVKDEAARQAERAKVTEMELKSEISVSRPFQRELLLAC